MAGQRIDCTAAAVDAAKSVLIELMHILGEYRDDMVLVGGWIPDLLIPTSLERHVGSIDVDVALNHRELTEAGYRMIGEILRQHGYTPDPQQPFIFRKAVRGQMVQVDFLAGEYGVYFVLQNYPGGVDEVVKSFHPHLKLGLVQEGLKKLAGKFASLDHVGPRDAAEFEEALDRDERAIRQRDAFEKVNHLLRQLGMG